VKTLLVSLLLVSSPALIAEAQEDGREQARVLFTEGVEASAASDWETAAGKFEEAQRLHPAPTIEYNLASAYLELGRVGEAGDLTASVLANPETSEEVRAHAEELDGQIAERAGTLTIEVSGEANAGALVAVDGRRLAPERIGVPRHETPGTRSITLTRGDGSVEQQSVSVTQSSPARASFGPPLLGGDDGDSEGGLLTDPIFWAVVGGGVLLTIIIVAAAVAAGGGGGEVGGDYDPAVLRF